MTEPTANPDRIVAIGQELKRLKLQRLDIERREQELMRDLQSLVGGGVQLGTPVPDDEEELSPEDRAALEHAEIEIQQDLRRKQEAEERRKIPQKREVELLQEMQPGEKPVRRRKNMLEDIRRLLNQEPGRSFTIPEIRSRILLGEDEVPSFYAALSKLVKFQQVDRPKKGMYQAHRQQSGSTPPSSEKSPTSS